MSDLSAYRAAMRRIIEADDVEETLKDEGFGDAVADTLRHNKAFHASRSVQPRVKPKAS